MANLFAKNLRYLRTRKGETQAGMAIHVGKGQTTIGNWETGVSQPSIEELLLLSNFFGVEIGNLIATDLTSSEIVLQEPGESYGPAGEDAIRQRDAVIEALNGQIEALKIAMSQMQARLDVLDKKQGE